MSFGRLHHVFGIVCVSSCLNLTKLCSFFRRELFLSYFLVKSWKRTVRMNCTGRRSLLYLGEFLEAYTLWIGLLLKIIWVKISKTMGFGDQIRVFFKLFRFGMREERGTPYFLRLFGFVFRFKLLKKYQFLSHNL